MEKCKNCDEEIPLNQPQLGGVHMECEDSYFHQKTERMIKFRPGAGYSWVVMTPTEATSALADSHERFEKQEVYMSKAEVNALKEFTGW